MQKYLVEFLGPLVFVYVILATGNPLAIGAALAIPTGGLSAPGAAAAVSGGATLGGSIGGGLGNIVDAFSY